MPKRILENSAQNNGLNFKNSKNYLDTTQVTTHPLYLAIMSDNIEAVREWCNNIRDFASIKEQYGTTALHWAAQHGNEQIALHLLHTWDGSDFNEQGLATPLEVAIANNHLALGEMLINYTGPNIPFNVLHKAALTGSAEQVEYLLKNGADPKILTCDQNEISALHLAARKGNYENVLALLHVATHIEFYGKKEVTPVDLALEGGYKKIANIISREYESLKIPTLIYFIERNNIKHLELCSITTLNLEQVANALKNNHSVTALSIFTTTLEGERGKIIADILEYNKFICILNIQNCKLNYRAAIDIGKAIGHSEIITCLTFIDNFIDVGGIKTILENIKLSNSINKLELIGVLIDGGEIQEIIKFIKSSKTLTDLNIEGNGMNPEEIKAIATAIGYSNIIASLNLNGNNCSISAAHALANTIKMTQSLHSLSFTNNYINKQTIEIIISGLALNKSITKLDLSDNQMEKEGIIALASILEGTQNIRNLNLADNQIKEEYRAAIPQSLKLNYHLTHLILTYNYIDDEGVSVLAKSLKDNPYVKHLDLSNNHIGPVGAQAISNILDVNNSIKCLYLNNNQIEAKGTKALAGGLGKNHGVASLNLSGNAIEEEGIIAIALIIKDSNRTITRLCLSNNPMSTDSVKAIGDALKCNHSITHLHFSHNQLGTAGAVIFADMITFGSSLTHLDLKYNNIGPAGMRAIADAIMLDNCISHLFLCGNNIGPEGAQMIADAIMCNPPLVCLTINSNRIFSGGTRVIAKALVDNKLLTKLETEIYRSHEMENYKIDHIVNRNQLLVKQLARFLFDKYNGKGKQDNVDIKDIHNFTFYQKADESLLIKYLKEELPNSTKDKGVIKSKINSILTQANKFINDHYFYLKGICKKKFIDIGNHPSEEEQDNNQEITHISDTEFLMHTGDVVPREIMSYICKFIGEYSLWNDIEG